MMHPIRRLTTIGSTSEGVSLAVDVSPEPHSEEVSQEFYQTMERITGSGDEKQKRNINWGPLMKIGALAASFTAVMAVSGYFIREGNRSERKDEIKRALLVGADVQYSTVEVEMRGPITWPPTDAMKIKNAKVTLTDTDEEDKVVCERTVFYDDSGFELPIESSVDGTPLKPVASPANRTGAQFILDATC